MVPCTAGHLISWCKSLQDKMLLLRIYLCLRIIELIKSLKSK